MIGPLMLNEPNTDWSNNRHYEVYYSCQGQYGENAWMTGNMTIEKEEPSESEGKRKTPHTTILKIYKEEIMFKVNL